MGRRCTKRNGYKGCHFLYVLIMVQVECAPSKLSACRPNRVRAMRAVCAPSKSSACRPSRMRAVRAVCAPPKPSTRRPSRVRAAQPECAPPKPSARRQSRVLADQVACPSLKSGAPCSSGVQLVSTKQPCTDVYKGEGKVRLSTVTTIRPNNTYTFSANLPCNNNKMSGFTQITLQMIQPHLQPTQAWQNTYVRARTIINPHDFMNDYRWGSNSIQELYAGIPSSVLVDVVAYHLDIGMADLDGRVQFVVDLCDFMNHSADPALKTLRRTNDFRDARRKAAEKERKKDWKRPMTAMLNLELGSGWQRR